MWYGCFLNTSIRSVERFWCWCCCCFFSSSFWNLDGIVSGKSPHCNKLVDHSAHEICTIVVFEYDAVFFVFCCSSTNNSATEFKIWINALLTFASRISFYRTPPTQSNRLSSVFCLAPNIKCNRKWIIIDKWTIEIKLNRTNIWK